MLALRSSPCHICSRVRGHHPPPPPPRPHGPTPATPPSRAAARTCFCCGLGQSGICAAVVSRTRHELRGLYGDGDGGSCSLRVITDDEDDDDNDDVQHDVKDDPIVDSRRRLKHLRTRPTKASAGWGCTAHHNNETKGGGGGGEGHHHRPHPTWGGGGVWQPCIALPSRATTPPPPMVSPPPHPPWPPPPPLPGLGQSGICAAVVSRTRYELQLLNYEGCMAMVMVAAVL